VPGDRPHRRGDAGLRGRRRHQGARHPDADHADQRNRFAVWDRIGRCGRRRSPRPWLRPGRRLRAGDECD
jgi:hypothetical protein